MQLLPLLLLLLVLQLALLMQLLSQATIPCNWPVLSSLRYCVTAGANIRSTAAMAKSLGHLVPDRTQHKVQRIFQAVNFGRLSLEERKPCKLILGSRTCA